MTSGDIHNIPVHISLLFMPDSAKLFTCSFSVNSQKVTYEVSVIMKLTSRRETEAQRAAVLQSLPISPSLSRVHNHDKANTGPWGSQSLSV